MHECAPGACGVLRARTVAVVGDEPGVTARVAWQPRRRWFTSPTLAPNGAISSANRVSSPWSTGGARTLLAVPMLKENELIGAIAIYRQEVRPFTDKQIELVDELRRAGRHRHREHAPAQRAARIAAAADRHRRRAQGHQPLDLRSKGGADTLVESAARLCDADNGGHLLGRRREALSLRGELRLLA